MLLLLSSSNRVYPIESNRQNNSFIITTTTATTSTCTLCTSCARISNIRQTCWLISNYQVNHMLNQMNSFSLLYFLMVISAKLACQLTLNNKIVYIALISLEADWKKKNFKWKFTVCNQRIFSKSLMRLFNSTKLSTSNEFNLFSCIVIKPNQTLKLLSSTSIFN